MGLKLNGATSGSIELDPQANLGSDRVITLNATGNSTLTLPDANGTLDRLERAGNILQIVHGTTSTQVEVLSNTVTDTGLTATITPTAASSKILILVDHPNCMKDTNASSGIRMSLARNGTNVIPYSAWPAGFTGSSGSLYFGINFQYYDSPATTSPLTYKTTFNNYVSASKVRVQSDNIPSQITLMEIAQ